MKQTTDSKLAGDQARKHDDIYHITIIDVTGMQ